MSSYTKAQFITLIKSRSTLLTSISDTTLSTFIDSALRALSGKQPDIRVDADNTFVDGTDLYDLPTNCLDVYSVRDSDSLLSIHWSIENQGAGDKLRLGNIKQPSYQDEIEQSYYINPNQMQGLSSTSYTSFDIQYSILQTMSTVKDTDLEALYNHILYQACSGKAESIALSIANEDIVAELRDTDSSGAETNVRFTPAEKQIDSITKLAESYLQKFEKAVNVAFGLRS